MVRHSFLLSALGGLALPVLDASLRGSVVLVLAGVLCLVLRRHSAATRHLVWATAVMLVLLLPLLSGLLPAWRVLPVGSPTLADAPRSPVMTARTTERDQHVESPARRRDRSQTQVDTPAAPAPASTSAVAAIPPAINATSTASVPSDVAPSETQRPEWLLPAVWLAGCTLAILRLVLSAGVLQRSFHHCTRLGTIGHRTSPSALQAAEQSLVVALQTAAARMALTRPVELWLDAEPSMPVVWGLWRIRLRLPAEALHWSRAQLDSVLLHELAHVRRHDLLVLAMTQVACALNWFNPLLWLAAWRMHVERERACDDLVLNAGVKPSTYAGFLLDFVNRLQPAAGARTCGLAVALRSSLETRLTSVLHPHTNRRGLSRRVLAAVPVLGLGCAIPLAMLQATDQKPAAARQNPRPARGTDQTVPAADQPEMFDVSMLDGEWAGEKNGVKVTLAFPWTAPFQQAHWRVEQPGSVIEAELEIAGEPDRKSARLVYHSRGNEITATLGRVTRGTGNSLTLEISPDPRFTDDPKYPLVKGLNLKPQLPAQPRHGRPLPEGLDRKLAWGPEVNGLRAALVRPAALGEPDVQEIFDLRLVVQNVSDKPIHLRRGENVQARLRILQEGRTLSSFTDGRPQPLTYFLAPAEIVVMRLFPAPMEGESIAADANLSFAAELPVERAPAQFWTGNLQTGELVAAISGNGLLPANPEARALFKIWSAAARSDGRIPGALIGQLGEAIQTFTKNNPTHEGTPEFLELLKRLDADRDWTGAEALALLDQVAALHTIPIELVIQRENQHTLEAGVRLPAQWERAPWGAAHANGLRLAWMLEPSAREYRLETAVAARLLIHNSGRNPVVFRTHTFQQPEHRVFNSQGGELELDSTHWMTLGRLMPYRLAPGEFIEIHCPGIGFGVERDREDWQNARAGDWIHAEAGDEIAIGTAPVPLHDWNEEPPEDGKPGWWLDFIRARLARHNPLPAAPEERKRMLYRVAMELFRNPASNAISQAFAQDSQPDALERVARQLARETWVTPFSGELDSAETKVRILPPDPDAARRPRVVKTPGWFTVHSLIRLSVSRRPSGDRFINEAYLQFFAQDAKLPPPGPVYPIRLPDGFGTWAAGWHRDGTQLWLKGTEGYRRIDFANPQQVTESDMPENDVPADIRDALRAALAEQ